MDLWIRSQDRKKLMKVDEVKIETVKDGNTFIYTHATDLGTYETKERALEVLDDIQNKIIKGTFAEIRNGLNELKDIKPNPIYVYEMPLK